jgi:hypothetical protein
MLRALWSNKYQFYSLWFDPTKLEPTINLAQDKQANHYTSDAIGKIMNICISNISENGINSRKKPYSSTSDLKYMCLNPNFSGGMFSHPVQTL